MTDEDDEHASGNMSYVPSYGYYDWLAPNPQTQYGMQGSVPSAPAYGT